LQVAARFLGDAEPVLAQERRRIFFSWLAILLSGAVSIFQRYGASLLRTITGIERALPSPAPVFNRIFNRTHRPREPASLSR